MKELIISTNLRDDGVLEIYHGNKLLCCVGDGRADEDFVEDILYGLGYQWNQDGTIIPLNCDTEFKVGDKVYADDWCYGEIISISCGFAVVTFDTESGGGTFQFKLSELRHE